MRYLIICVMFFTSCVTVEKAKRVLDQNPQAAAEYCATKYPVKERIDSVIKSPDPQIIRNAVDSAVKIQDSICNDYANAMNDLIAEQQKLISEGNKTSSVEFKFLEKRIDSLKKDYQARVLKESKKLADAVPPKIIEVTKVVENTAKVEYYRIESEKQARKVEEFKGKFSKWKKIALISIGINLILLLFVFRKPIIGLFGKLLGIGIIPPI